MMTLTIKAGKLLALDWHDDKTTRLYERFGQSMTFVAYDDLVSDDDNHATALAVIGQLDEYFLGQRTDFDVPLDLSHGTAFQVQVWQALQHIPHGQTISYKELACAIGKPTAFRACANANGKNPISLIVPCHRVIASDGTIGGYTGGVAIKKTLLAVEGWQG